MKSINKLLAGLSLIFLVCACSVDDGGNSCTDDFTGELEARENVLVGTWTLTAIISEQEVDLTQDGVENPSGDIFAQYPDCSKDAEYIFESNRAYSFMEGQNFTECSNQLVVEGTWKFTGLAINLNGSCAVQTIPIRFNDDSTEFSYSGINNYTDVDGQTVQTKTTFTFTAN